MASFSNVNALILILLSYNCEVSSGNQYDTQFSKIEEELQNMMESILNLRRDLHKERTERKENTEMLNRKTSQCACEIQSINQQQNISENVKVGCDVSGCADPKKVMILERGLAKEKVFRIITEEKVSSLEKELQNLRNLVESRMNEQKDDLKAHDAKLKAFENQTGKVKTDVESLKTDLTKMENNIRTDLMSHSPKIAFHARLTNSISTFSYGDLIVFDDVYLNLGDGYQRNRGVFSAPVTGLYIVMITVSSESNPAPDYEVVRNGIPLCRVSIAIGIPNWVGSPCNSIVHLSKGDEVWIKVVHLHTKDTIRGSSFTTFSMGLLSSQ